MSILFSLITMRMSGATALSPVFGRTNVSSRMKAVLILVVLLMLYAGPGRVLVHEFAVVAEYGAMLIRELLFSLTLGFGMELAFLTVRFTSAVMDYSTGFAAVQVYNPQYNARMTITTDMYYAFIVVLSPAANGHLWLLTIFFISCELIPFGIMTFRPELAQAILLIFRKSITMGLQFAFPLIAIELVAETAVGILMRMTPQVNVFVVNFRIKIIVDMPMLLFLSSPMSDKLYVILDGIYQSLQQTVTLMRWEAGRR